MRSSGIFDFSKILTDLQIAWLAWILGFAVLGAIMMLTPRPTHTLDDSFQATTAKAYAALARLEVAQSPQASAMALVDLLQAGRAADRIATAAGEDQCLGDKAIALSDWIARLKVDLITHDNALPADLSARGAALREDIGLACSP